MFVHMSIHQPKAGKEELLIASMHRFGEAAKTQPGLQQVHTLRDAESGALIGLAIWDSKEAMIAARPVLMEATKDDDFEAWEDSVTGYRLEEV